MKLTALSFIAVVAVSSTGCERPPALPTESHEGRLAALEILRKSVESEAKADDVEVLNVIYDIKKNDDASIGSILTFDLKGSRQEAVAERIRKDLTFDEKPVSANIIIGISPVTHRVSLRMQAGDSNSGNFGTYSLTIMTGTTDEAYSIRNSRE